MGKAGVLMVGSGQVPHIRSTEPISKVALHGLKAVEIGDFISASYCSKLLADMGAEVIKVEPPGIGDSARRYGPFPKNIPHSEKSGLFCYLNSNKLGITLNLSTFTGQSLLRRLLKESDLLITNFSSIVLEKWGLTYDSLSAENEKIIMTIISPFGQTGPYRNYKAYAINCAAAGGMSNTIGEIGREPIAPPLSLGHYQSGVAAATASLVALIGRRKGRKGQMIDVSEAEVWATLHTGLMVHYFVTEGRKRIRGGHRTPGFYPYTILPCKDGYVSLIALTGRQWKDFLELLGDGKVPDWYTKDSRFADRWVNSLKYADELDQLLSPWLMSHTKEEIFRLCQERHIPFAPVRTIAEVVEDAHLNRRGYFVEISHREAGAFKYPGTPYKFSKTPWRIGKPAPLLGQDNEMIFCQRLEVSSEELVKLRRTGVI